jgi:hypothetical protein
VTKTSLIATFLATIVLFVGCWSPPKPESGRGDSEPSRTPEKRETKETPGANMNAAEHNDEKKTGFEANLPSGFVPPADDVGRKLLKEYGAVFIARGGAKPPTTVIFKDEAAVSLFQNSLTIAAKTVGGVSIELQSAAMDALEKAVTEAKSSGKAITPRGADAARRNYTGTVELWKSRVEPGLKHWTGNGRITASEAARISGLSPFEQVQEILKLESQGIFFAKDLSKSIIYSVAPPGTSQHLSMLALDITEHDQADVRATLAKHGWYQTVVSDLPHFTFLGVQENELTRLGLKKEINGRREYWLPSF